MASLCYNVSATHFCVSNKPTTPILYGSWVRDYSHNLLLNEFTHLCRNFNGCLIKSPLKFGHWWVLHTILYLVVITYPYPKLSSSWVDPGLFDKRRKLISQAWHSNAHRSKYISLMSLVISVVKIYHLFATKDSWDPYIKYLQSFIQTGNGIFSEVLEVHFRMLYFTNKIFDHIGVPIATYITQRIADGYIYDVITFL